LQEIEIIVKCSQSTAHIHREQSERQQAATAIHTPRPSHVANMDKCG
jgi:hypothetical protein